MHLVNLMTVMPLRKEQRSPAEDGLRLRRQEAGRPLTPCQAPHISAPSFPRRAHFCRATLRWRRNLRQHGCACRKQSTKARNETWCAKRRSVVLCMFKPCEYGEVGSLRALCLSIHSKRDLQRLTAALCCCNLAVSCPSNRNKQPSVITTASNTIPCSQNPAPSQLPNSAISHHQHHQQ